MLTVLKETLERNGISHDEAADIIGRSKRTFLKTLKGERDIYLHEFLRLQTVLHERGCELTLDEMIDPEGAPAN